MPGSNEAFSRVKIDAQLKDQGWDVLSPNAVRFEYVLPDMTKADYVLCDRHGRALAVVEAKRAAINPAEAEAQAKAYAEQLNVPYVARLLRFWPLEFLLGMVIFCGRLCFCGLGRRASEPKSLCAEFLPRLRLRAAGYCSIGIAFRDNLHQLLPAESRQFLLVRIVGQ